MFYYAFLLTEFAFVLLMVNGRFSEEASAVPGDKNLLPEEKGEEGNADQDESAKEDESDQVKDEEGMTKALVYWDRDDFYKTEDGPGIADKMLKSVTEFLGKHCKTPTKKVEMKPYGAAGEAVLSGIPAECARTLATFLKKHPRIKYVEPEEKAKVTMDGR